ncbi:MAG: ABC transporter ATP-binding protein [Candidatus Atribacteria bacterium]|nr:ABC transporter ATP-binding protein [Candidatus Atribacteria bacterium]
MNLEVEKGDIFGFLGNNGAGKTTTIRILFGLVHPTSGDFQVFDHRCPSQLNQAKKVMSGVVDTPSFYETLSGRENLLLLSSLSGFQPSPDELLTVSQMVGIDRMLNRPVRIYSNGQKRRLSIAQALLPRPDLIILDEPTSGLDPQGVKSIRDIILQLNTRYQLTVFFSSHLLSEVQKICNRVAIIDQGKILKVARVDDLLFDSFFNIHAIPQEQLIHYLKEKGIPFQIKEKYVMARLDEENIPSLLEGLTRNGIAVYEIFRHQFSLEEAFLETIEGAQK